MEIVPVEEELIPTSNPPAVEEVTVKEPEPDVAPIILPVTVPTFTLPDAIFIPQKTPYAVLAPLVVSREIAAIVLP